MVLAAYVPQHHREGAQAEVDFYEAAVDFPWGRETAQVMAVRSEASAAARHRAYPAQTQAAFFDGIAHGLSFHGGVFPVMRWRARPCPCRLTRPCCVGAGYRGGDVIVPEFTSAVVAESPTRPLNQGRSNVRAWRSE